MFPSESPENVEFDDWSCDFEVTSQNRGGWCGMLNDSRSTFDWIRSDSDTPSGKTGPSEAASGKGFLYFESSNRDDGDKA